VITGSSKRLIGRLAVGALVLSGVSLSVAGPANAGPTPSVVVSSTLVTKTVSNIRPNEATYPGWHEGYANSSPAYFVGWDGVHLGIGARSQIINGLVDGGTPGLPVTGVALGDLITGSQISTESGEVSMQVAITTANGWGTLRPAVLSSTSTQATLADMWMSSKTIGAEVIQETPMTLGSLLTALDAQGNLRYSAYGFLAMAPAVVSAMSWGPEEYNFVTWETRTTLSGQSSSVFGSDVTYTAKVSTIIPSGGVPAGDVQFWSDASPLGNAVPLVDGSASFTVKDLPIGATTITAKYQGSEPFLASSARDSQTVTKAPTTVTVPMPDGTLVGSNVVLTATVSSGAGVPTGKVDFYVDGEEATSVDLVDGKATFTVTKVHVGLTNVFAEYLGSATHGGSWSDTDIAVAFPTATGTTNEIYVKHVYRDLFGRNPDPAGLALWTAKLDGGTPRGAVANAITYSTEFRSGLISNAYGQYLGRTPDPAGLKGWLGAMSRGLTVSQMESGFISSPEYYAASGDTDWAWVDRMYLAVLDRPAATSEVKRWVQRLSNGSSRQQVSMGFLLSSEHLSTVVNGMYVALLNRDLDSIGEDNWVRILQAGGRDEAIIAGIVASEEYFSQI
jgi:hypothetical protein